MIALTRSLNDELDADGVRAIALCPGFVDTPMAQWSGIEPDEMIRPEDCAEVVRMCLRLSPTARIPQVVIERMGSRAGDVYVARECTHSLAGRRNCAGRKARFPARFVLSCLGLLCRSDACVVRSRAAEAGTSAGPACG